MTIAGRQWTLNKKTGSFRRKISLFPYLRGKIRLFLCQFGIHKGNIYTKGRIKLEDPPAVSKNRWFIRRCFWCGGNFVEREDRIN